MTNSFRKQEYHLVNDLHTIQEIILKLVLINNSSNHIKGLDELISYFKDKLAQLQKQYSDISIDNFILEQYPRNMYYDLALSCLLDELNEKSKVYFILEQLKSFELEQINSDNIDFYREKLINIDFDIYKYQTDNLDLNVLLRDTLTNVLYNFLEKEVQFTNIHDFYMELSISSQLKIKEKYFQELAKYVNQDVNIKNYLEKSDISNLSFDYEIFSYLKDIVKEKSDNDVIADKQDIVEVQNNQNLKKHQFSLSIFNNNFGRYKLMKKFISNLPSYNDKNHCYGFGLKLRLEFYDIIEAFPKEIYYILKDDSISINNVLTAEVVCDTIYDSKNYFLIGTGENKNKKIQTILGYLSMIDNNEVYMYLVDFSIEELKYLIELLSFNVDNNYNKYLNLFLLAYSSILERKKEGTEYEGFRIVITEKEKEMIKSISEGKIIEYW